VLQIDEVRKGGVALAVPDDCVVKEAAE